MKSYSCPECSEYLGNGHRAACSRYPANQVKYPTGDWHVFMGRTSYILSSDPNKWEEEAKKANEKMYTLTVHPKFMLDILQSLDSARRENDDLKRRFKDAVEKLMKV